MSAGTILLVEDEAAVRQLAAMLLTDAGYTVHESRDAETALARADESVDLLISDVNLPGQRGPDLARRFRLAHPGLPVLLISGVGTEDEEAVEPPAEFLAKPFLPEDLTAAVHRLIAAGG